MATITPIMPEIDFGVDDLEDFEDRIAALYAEGHRVVPIRYTLGGIAWLVLGYDEVSAAFLDPHLPPGPAVARHAAPVMGRTILMMEGKEHRTNKALVQKAFQPSAIRNSITTLLAPIANEIVDNFGDMRKLDLVANYTHRYPFNIISRMLGIDVEDEARVMKMLDGLVSYPWHPEMALRARADMTAFLASVLHDRRQNPGDDLISQLAMAEQEGEKLTDEEIFSFLRLLYPAGAETTFLVMGSLMLEVLSDRTLYQRLIDQPQDRPAAIEEALRCFSPTTTQPRYVEDGITIAGVDIPAGSFILLGNLLANHDPSVYPEPKRFIIDRPNRRHLAFGLGVHVCLGIHLAREELRISLDVLLDRLPGLRIDPDARPARTGFAMRGVQALPVIFDDILPAA